jgi:hypothetical protein
MPAAGVCATCSQPLAGRYGSHRSEEAHDARNLTGDAIALWTL